MSLEILNIFTYSQTALSALVAILALVNYSSKEPSTKLIGLLFLIGFFTNSFSLIFYYLGIKGYGNVSQSIYDISTIIVLSLLYNYALENKYSRIFFSVSIGYLVFFFINLFLIQKTSINSYSKWVSSLIIICYSLSYFYWLIKELPSTHLHRIPMFWFNSAFMIYYSGALFLFIFTSYLVNVLNNNLMTYWAFHNSLSIIEHIVILIGLYHGSRNRSLEAVK